MVGLDTLELVPLRFQLRRTGREICRMTNFIKSGQNRFTVTMRLRPIGKQYWQKGFIRKFEVLN